MVALIVIAMLESQAGGMHFDPESPVFPQGLTCRQAWQIESETGGKPMYDGPYDPHRGLVVTRNYLGFNASVIYLCNDELVHWRIITVSASSLGAVLEVVAKHKKVMIERFGAPCWDPRNLTEQQRLLLPNGVPTDNL